MMHGQANIKTTSKVQSYFYVIITYGCHRQTEKREQNTTFH